MSNVNRESDLTDFGTWQMDYSDRYFRYWVYKRSYTPYEQEQKFSDESLFEEDGAKYGFIREAMELPDGDVLLGFNDPTIAEDYMEYYKLSEIRLAYDPQDQEEMEEILEERESL